MNYLTPEYRILLNKNLTFNPQYFEFLKQSFNFVLMQKVMQAHLDLMETYRFVIYCIPVEYHSPVIQQVSLMDQGLLEPTEKLQKISEILHALNPIDAQPVELSFTLQEIISFVKKSLKHFQEVVPGGVVDYFGINYQTWFDDYPIQTGTILKAVDYGTLENYPHHLFDGTFDYLREHLLDLFTEFNQMIVPEKPKEMVNNVNVQEL